MDLHAPTSGDFHCGRRGRQGRRPAERYGAAQALRTAPEDGKMPLQVLEQFAGAASASLEAQSMEKQRTAGAPGGTERVPAIFLVCRHRRRGCIRDHRDNFSSFFFFIVVVVLLLLL